MRDYPHVSHYAMVDLASQHKKDKEFLEKGKHSPEKILEDICEVFEKSIDVVISKKREREIVRCRQILCYIARTKTVYSYKSIGQAIGGRDHTTVIHSLQAIQDLFDSKDSNFLLSWDHYLDNSKLFTKADFQ